MTFLCIGIFSLINVLDVSNPLCVWSSLSVCSRNILAKTKWVASGFRTYIVNLNLYYWHSNRLIMYGLTWYIGKQSEAAVEMYCAQYARINLFCSLTWYTGKTYGISYECLSYSCCFSPWCIFLRMYASKLRFGQLWWILKYCSTVWNVISDMQKER